MSSSFLQWTARARRVLAARAVLLAILPSGASRAAAGGDSGDIATANADLAEGNQDAALGQPEKAIEGYGAAWRRPLGAVK